MLLEWFVLLLFPALMIFAGLYDLFTMTIPNKISLALVAAFICVAAAAGLGWQAIGIHLAVGFVLLVVTIGLFAMGWIGGGDAKLFPAAGLWMGTAHLLEFAVIAAVCGGLLTIAILFLRSLPLPAGLAGQAWLARLHDADRGVPYGVALSAAGLIVYPDIALVQSLT